MEYYTAVKNLQIDIGRNAEVFYKRIPMVKQDFTNALLGTIPDVDPQYVNFVDLRNWVMALRTFLMILSAAVRKSLKRFR